MTVFLAGYVGCLRSGIEDDNADIADRNHRLCYRLDRRKQPVDVPGAFDDDLQLPSAIAAAFQEFLGLLEIIVKGLVGAQIGSDLRRDDLAGRQRRTVVHGHNPDEVVACGEHHRRESAPVGNGLLHAVEHAAFLSAQRVTVNAVVGDDGKLRGIDRVGAFAQDLALRALLAATQQESPRILIVRFVFGVVGAEHLRCTKRCAVACEHIGDGALSDRDEIGFVDAIHEREEHVQAAAQHLRLVAGFNRAGR